MTSAYFKKPDLVNGKSTIDDIPRRGLYARKDIFFAKEAKFYEKYGLDAEVDGGFVEELNKSGFLKKLYEN
jgi:hypothetical protein